jgi:hypothetical protein
MIVERRQNFDALAPAGISARNGGGWNLVSQVRNRIAPRNGEGRRRISENPAPFAPFPKKRKRNTPKILGKHPESDKLHYGNLRNPPEFLSNFRTFAWRGESESSRARRCGAHATGLELRGAPRHEAAAKSLSRKHIGRMPEAPRLCAAKGASAGAGFDLAPAPVLFCRQFWTKHTPRRPQSPLVDRIPSGSHSPSPGPLA